MHKIIILQKRSQSNWLNLHILKNISNDITFKHVQGQINSYTNDPTVMGSATQQILFRKYIQNTGCSASNNITHL